MPMHFFFWGGGGGRNKVHYGKCGSGVSAANALETPHYFLLRSHHVTRNALTRAWNNEG